MAASTKSLQQFLLWARKERIVISSVQMQGVTITIERDYQLQPPKGVTMDSPDSKQSLYQQFAGSLLQQIQQPAAPEQKNEPTEEDEGE
jgi:hypothetical protein